MCLRLKYLIFRVWGTGFCKVGSSIMIFCGFATLFTSVGRQRSSDSNIQGVPEKMSFS